MTKKMEIEAKFILPDQETLHRLQALDQIATYTLGESRVHTLHDIYLDTVGRRLMTGGYACRQRDAGNRFYLTLKALPTSSEDAIHRREELEIELNEPPTPFQWPAGPLRDRVIELAGNEPLLPLIQLRQRRTVRPLLRDGKTIAEMGLDEVRLGVGENEHQEYELEIELTAAGMEEDLHTLAEMLQQEWHLTPQKLSKLQRALALMEASLPHPTITTAALPLETLLTTYRVDRHHARTVADHALALFDAMQPIHRLAPDRRGLLETAALLHNIGLETDPDNHHVIGRDILQSHPPTELSADEQRMVALTTLLHRKKMSEKKLDKVAADPLMVALPAFRRDETLILAALLRIADGLDSTQNGTTRIIKIHNYPGEIEIDLAGPEVQEDSVRAGEKSDLWALKFDTVIRFIPILPTETTRAVSSPTAPGIIPDDTMAEAARKTLYFQLQQMLAYQSGTREGLDPENLHKMRVATRRMRAALDFFEEAVDQKRMAAFLKGLRRTGRMLGAVRDLDVFHIKIQTYLAGLPPEQQGSLGPLLTVWSAERQRAQAELIAYLDAPDYAKFVEEFNAYLLRPSTLPPHRDPPQPYRVRDLVPLALYRNLAAVRAYDAVLTTPPIPFTAYHQLRIAFKGLRYSLEFFREVLHPDAALALETVKQFQDHLGDLQDAVVATARLRDFLVTGRWTPTADLAKDAAPLPGKTLVAPGVATYLAFRQAEIQTLIADFPALWAQLQTPEFRQALANAVATL